MLCTLRDHLGLNQVEMGTKLGVSRNYVSMIEKGRSPSKSVRMLIENLWETTFGEGVSLEDLPPKTSGARSKLKAAREAKGMTPSQLAKAVGYSLAVYQEIEDGRSGMGEKMARRVAEVLGIDEADLTNGSDHPPTRNGMHGTFGATPDIELPPGMKAKYVPLLSMAQCGTMVAYDDTAYTHDGFLAFDPKDPKAFAVKLAGDSMAPRFEAGDVAIVYPSKPPKNGGVVIARLNDDHGGDVMLKLYQASGDSITLSSYNAAYPPMTFTRAAFAWIYPVAQLSKEL